MAQKGRAHGTTTLPEMRRGEVALSLATVICRVAWPGSPATGAANQQIAYSKAQGQLAYYRLLAAQGPLIHRMGTCIGPWVDSCARYTNVDLPPPALARIHSMMASRISCLLSPISTRTGMVPLS